jgi:Cu/Ag efflux pump CusA
LLSLLVIFFLLYLEFKDLKMSVIILLNLPLALIGGVFSVWLSSGILSISAIIGFITLFGVATRNGILLVSHYKVLLDQGMNLNDTVIQGSKDRLNPILMTALTAGLALIPLAVGGDLPGNEIQSPMAKVILGGLLSSTLLNLFVVPIVYLLANKNSDKK